MHDSSSAWASALIHSRRTTLPKRLRGPGPDAEQRACILQAAAAAPDHDQILPWRFIEVPESRRAALGQAFADALIERDPQADAQACSQAREKAMRSPWLLLVVVRTGGEPAEIPAAERVLSAGAAIQNMLLMATALGFGSALTSGKALKSGPLRALFRLGPHERALTFISIGTPGQRKPGRPRPHPGQYISTLEVR